MKYFYGGAFNPMTKAHLYIIQSILSSMKHDDKLVIAITNHDYKNYDLDFDIREEILQVNLNHYCTDKIDQIDVVEQNKRTWKFLTENPFYDFKSEPLTLILGEDEYNDLKSLNIWHYSKEILDTFPIKVFSRSNELKDISVISGNEEIKDVGILAVNFRKEIKDISSTRVRELLKTDIVYKDLKKYITKETWYILKSYIGMNELKNELNTRTVEEYAMNKANTIGKCDEYLLKFLNRLLKFYVSHKNETVLGNDSSTYNINRVNKWITTEVEPLRKTLKMTLYEWNDAIENIDIDDFVHMMILIDECIISKENVKEVLKEEIKTGESLFTLIYKHKYPLLEYENNNSELEDTINQLIQNNSEKIKELKNGNTKIINYFVGQIMKLFKNKVNPKDVHNLIETKLKEI